MKKTRTMRLGNGSLWSRAIGTGIALTVAGTAMAAADSGYVARANSKPYLFYVGGGIGEYWINSEHKHHAINGWEAFPVDKAFVEERGSGKINGSEFTISAFMGVDYRQHNWLLGWEFDANYIGFHRRTEVAPGLTMNGQADFFNSIRISHLETLRARIGYTFGHTTLFMTGGLALGEVDFNQSINFPGSTASYADGRQMKYGWVIGGGIERQLSKDVSFRAEYLYADLGKLTKNYTNNCPNVGPANPFCLAFYNPGFDHRVEYDVSTQILRVGLKIAMSEFGGGDPEPYKAGLAGAYVDYSAMKTDFTGLYISPIVGTLTGQTTFALERYNNLGGMLPTPYGTTEVHKVKLDGFTFGGVLGYQKQFGNLVLGTDVSLQSGANVNGKSDCSPSLIRTLQATCASRLVYDAAWRIRAGYAMNKWMVYVNGGPAFAKIDNEVTYAGTGLPVPTHYLNEKGSAFTTGWTYGAGIEWEWKPGYIFGISYNHTYLEDVIVDLRRLDGSTNSRRLISTDPDVIGSSLKIKLGETAQAAVAPPPAPATQQVAAAAAPPPAAAPAPQRPRPAAARPSAARPAAAQPAATPAVKATPKPTQPSDGTPTEPAPAKGKPQK